MQKADLDFIASHISGVPEDRRCAPCFRRFWQKSNPLCLFDATRVNLTASHANIRSLTCKAGIITIPSPGAKHCKIVSLYASMCFVGDANPISTAVCIFSASQFSHTGFIVACFVRPYLRTRMLSCTRALAGLTPLTNAFGASWTTKTPHSDPM